MGDLDLNFPPPTLDLPTQRTKTTTKMSEVEEKKKKEQISYKMET